MHVTIIARPGGEAPDWVRDAWIGLRLPLARRGERNWRGVGVLTGPRGLAPKLRAILRGQTIRKRGYVVNAKAAVELLSRANPEAAAWWREHRPDLLTGRSGFGFESDVCRVGEG